VRSAEIGELVAALAAFQADVKAIPKTETNLFFQSKYAGLPQVVEAVQPLLSKHGLTVSQSPVYIPRGSEGLSDGLQTILFHTSGQFLESTMLLHLPNKGNPQDQGSAITYARRYSYMAVLGLVADVDDDGNAASLPKASASAETRRAPASPTVRRSVPQSAPVEARVGAADAKRELIRDALDKGWDEVGAKRVAARVWGDRGSEPVLQSELLLMLMGIENGPGK